ncbi:gp16 [Erannis ankeraria nucleopolyhedrovirus]|uniref:gp16 n=1 Tax=Erannis ankeraria nucleopolyhedrovirus TaxID=2913600 RepID=UPI002481FA9E|nr:gp16 [Erannis ankeraria nucleopolyhedrovirus]UJZ88979.1 gp16 [Erannis ankeraria nucleopolyhedrovirus]
MNYSMVALVLLVGYMIHSGSLMNEIQAIKQLLVVTYEMIESKFANLTNDLFLIKNETMMLFEHLQNSSKHSIELILNNSNKIDVINNKIDVILNRH